MKGAIEGKYHIDGMPVTPYLVPQENGMHMNTQKLFITRNTTQNNTDHILNPFSLKIQQSDLPFNFSLLPYTSEELENATHIEELPLERRAVLVIAGCVAVLTVGEVMSNLSTQFLLKKTMISPLS